MQEREERQISRRTVLKGLLALGGAAIGMPVAISVAGDLLKGSSPSEKALPAEVQKQIDVFQTAVDKVCKKGAINIAGIVGNTAYNSNEFNRLFVNYEGGMALRVSFTDSVTRAPDAGKDADMVIDLAKDGDTYTTRYITLFPNPNGTLRHVDISETPSNQPLSSAQYSNIVERIEGYGPSFVDSLFLFHPEVYVRENDPSKPKPSGSSFQDLPATIDSVVLIGLASDARLPEDVYSFYFTGEGRFSFEKTVGIYPSKTPERATLI